MWLFSSKQGGDSAQATTADYLDLTEHPRRVELTEKQGVVEHKHRFSSLRSIPVGTTFTTQRGNRLERVSDTEVLLSGKVQVPVPPPRCQASDSASDVGSVASSAVSNVTWNEIEQTHSRLICNVVKPAATTLVGMLLDESKSGGGVYVEVAKLLPEGAAAAAGIRVGDLVLKVDHTRVYSETTAADLMRAPGVHVLELARRRSQGQPPNKRFPSIAGTPPKKGDYAFASADDAASMVSMASSATSGCCCSSHAPGSTQCAASRR